MVAAVTGAGGFNLVAGAVFVPVVAIVAGATHFLISWTDGRLTAEVVPFSTALESLMSDSTAVFP